MSFFESRTPISPTESQIQVALIEWVRTKERQHPKLANVIAYPSQGGAGREAIIRGQIRRREGQVKGFPDVMMLFPSACAKYPAGFLEIKREGEKPRKDQKEWIERLRDYGYFADYAAGFDAAKTILERYAGI